MGDIIEELEEYLENTPEEELEEEWESITHDQFYERWIDKLHKLTLKERTDFIQKCINKYTSDEYIQREYKLGYEPRRGLYDIIYKYAERFGIPVETYCSNFFYNSAYKIDNAFVIRLLIRQGSDITVYTIDDWNKEQERLKNLGYPLNPAYKDSLIEWKTEIPNEQGDYLIIIKSKISGKENITYNTWGQKWTLPIPEDYDIVAWCKISNIKL